MLLLRIPPMLADIIRAITLAEDSLAVVVRDDGSESPLAAAAASDADVVVVPMEAPALPVSCRALLAARPRTRLLGLVGDGRTATLWELRPHREEVGELSPETLVAALRRPEWTRHAPAPG